MFEGEVWYEYLDEPMKELVDLGYFLLDREEMSGDVLSNYGFVIFPVAKAYEGFVKKWLFDLELIDSDDLMGRHFRIGRSMNPSLPDDYKNDKWLYGRLDKLWKSQRDGVVDLPKMIWDGWKKGRNEIFHYFVGETGPIDLSEARKRIEMMVEVIKIAVTFKDDIKKNK